MIIDNNTSRCPEIVIYEGKHSNAELEFKRLLTLHTNTSEPNNATVVAWLHSLAQALEGQGKYAEGLDTRIRARDMLISLMSPS